MRVGALILLAMPADACLRRLMQVCSSSQPSEPGKVSFYFGVTECWKYQAPGELHIKTPTGVVLTGKWNDWRCTRSCNGNGRNIATSTGSWTMSNQCRNGKAPEPRSGDKASQFMSSVRETYLLPADADVTCYKEKQGAQVKRETGNWWYPATYNLFQSQALQADEVNSHTCYSRNRIYAWFKVTISEAVTGEFEVWATNSKNRHYSQGDDYGSPCTMSYENHFMMRLTVAAYGKSCTAFTGTIDKATVPNACASATASIPNGFLCDVQCPSPNHAVGQLSCDDGKWVNTYQCTDKTCRSTATTEFTGMTSVAGAGCGMHTAVGTKCIPTCERAGEWAASNSEVTCKADGTWSGAGKCLPAGDDILDEQAQHVEFYPETPGTANPLVLTWDPPKSTHSGKPVTSYKITVAAGSATGLPQKWNSPTPPSAGLKFTNAGTSPLSISVAACDGSNPPVCEPGVAVQQIAQKTDRSKVCYGDLKGFEFKGNAFKLGDDELALTSASNSQAGGAFSVKTIDPANFEAEFEIYVGDRDRGADGLTFTVVDTARWNGNLGLGGGYMGNNNLPGFVVEFDTWNNGGWDQTAKDHVALFEDGIRGKRISGDKMIGPGGNIENGAWHPVKVTSRNGKVTVSVNGKEHINIAYTPSFTEGRYGWTGATGGERNAHKVRNHDFCMQRGNAGVSGDPFVVGQNGEKVQFFLPFHEDVEMLHCKNMQLYGRAFGSEITGDHQQWFDQFRVVVDGKEELTVQIAKNSTEINDDADISTQGAKSDKPLTILSVTVEKEGKMTKTGAIGLESSALIAVWHSETAETVQYSLGSTVMQIKSAVAQKFSEKQVQKLYTHLDLRFLELKTADCTAGVLAEIWGSAPMSQKTAAMLEPR